MRLLIFSDVHGNLPALEEMINREVVDGYINLGDVVNYGPWSNECVELIDSLPRCQNLIGNHETYFINNHCDVKNDLVVAFFNTCIADFKYADKIKKYNKELWINDFHLIHTLNAKDYIFHDSDVSINHNTILGHSHQQYRRNIDTFCLINPGSVGQNRKIINEANYAIWDLHNNDFKLKQFRFDFNRIITEMKSKRYPPECIAYYQNKKRV